MHTAGVERDPASKGNSRKIPRGIRKHPRNGPTQHSATLQPGALHRMETPLGVKPAGQLTLLPPQVIGFGCVRYTEFEADPPQICEGSASHGTLQLLDNPYLPY
eukprot:RCo049826